MEALLSFFSDLILFTGGVVVSLLWLALFVVGAIEVWDLIFDKGESTALDEEDF